MQFTKQYGLRSQLFPASRQGAAVYITVSDPEGGNVVEFAIELDGAGGGTLSVPSDAWLNLAVVQDIFNFLPDLEEVTVDTLCAALDVVGYSLHTPDY